MTRDEATTKAVRYWLQKAREALASARDEAAAGRLTFAVNRCYYAAFYGASAVLLCLGHRFVKHSGTRAAVHRHLVKPGLLSADWGAFYNQLFQDRQEGDYTEFVFFEPEEVQVLLEKVSALLQTLETLANERLGET